MSANSPPEPEKVNVPIDFDGIRALAEPLVSAHGLTLFDVEWTNGPAGKILRVSIERPDAEGVPRGGVTLEHCVAVSRDLSLALDAAELIPQQYNLEVSSPGADRPLTSPRDYTRSVGRLAKLKLNEPVSDGQRVLRGKILGIDGDIVAIEVDGNRHETTLDNIQLAKLVFEVGGQKKKGQRRSKKGSTGRQRKRRGPRSEAAAGPRGNGS